MTVDHGSGSRNGFVDFEMQEDFTRVDPGADYLLVLQVNQTDIRCRKVNFTKHRRRAENVIAANSVRNVSAVPVHVFSGPQFSAHINDLFLDRLRFGRREKAPRRTGWGKFHTAVARQALD